MEKTNIDSTSEKITCCPYCKAEKFIKFGKSNGVQRFRCKNNTCRKTFNEHNYSPFRYSKKFRYMWKAYYELMQQGLTIRQCATEMKINIITAFFWRHRFLNSFLDSGESNEFKEQVEMSNVIYPESFKGCRIKMCSERDRINIVSLIDSKYSVESIALSRNTIRVNDIVEKIYYKIHKDAVVIAYQDGRLMNFAKKHNANLGKSYEERVKRVKNFFNKNTIKSSVAKTIRSLEPIDITFGTKLRKWISKFRGVATKYIDYYLKWYGIIYSVEKSINFYKSNNKNYNNNNIIDNYYENNEESSISNYLRWIDIKGRKAVV